MKMIIKLNMGNAAFMENDFPNDEAARILREMAAKLERNPPLSEGNDCALFDSNGHEVGFMTVSEDDKVWNV